MIITTVKIPNISLTPTSSLLSCPVIPLHPLLGLLAIRDLLSVTTDCICLFFFFFKRQITWAGGDRAEVGGRERQGESQAHSMQCAEPDTGVWSHDREFMTWAEILRVGHLSNCVTQKALHFCLFYVVKYSIVPFCLDSFAEHDVFWVLFWFCFVLIVFAFILSRTYSWTLSFCFFSFFWDIFYFCAASSSGLETACSFLVRIISVWQGELYMG